MRTVALVAFTVAVFILFTGGDAYTINRKRRLSLDEGELWNIGLFEEYIGSTHGKKEKVKRYNYVNIIPYANIASVKKLST